MKNNSKDIGHVGDSKDAPTWNVIGPKRTGEGFIILQYHARQGRIHGIRRIRNTSIREGVTDLRTDGPTDERAEGPTDGQTLL